ncbi:hypothetical protein D3C78_1439300 [compost metagenome]
MNGPTLPGALHRLYVDAVHIPDGPVDAGHLVSQTEFTRAADVTIQQLIRQQAHRQIVGDQRQQARRFQRQYLGGNQHAGRFKQTAQTIHDPCRFTGG